MITWMQRHRKYLVITMWISAIAFIGAGFVGWGQYSYGEKATAVAKVGELEISMRELQQGYSRLYSQYNKAFKGNFDEAQAKSFGLEKQALKQLVDQSLILNLAQSYSLRVTDEELLTVITSETAFTKDGKFDKDVYQKVLRQNNLSIQEYEEDLTKTLLIQKTMELFAQKEHPIETKVINAALNIADKIDYKVLTSDMITVDDSEETLKKFWEGQKQEYLTLPKYQLSVVTQPRITIAEDGAAMQEYYKANRHDYKGDDGKLLTFEEATPKITAALDEKATHKEALRNYIAFKKEKLDSALTVESVSIDRDSDLYSAEIFNEITALTSDAPYLKPRKSGEGYAIIRLESVTPAVAKSFEMARDAVKDVYTSQQKQIKLQQLVKDSLESFQGQTTPFVTREYTESLEGLDTTESNQFLNALFDQQEKRGSITLTNEKIVMFNILEQELLKTSKTDQENSVLRLKATLLDQGLIKLLESKYAVEIYMGEV